MPSPLRIETRPKPESPSGLPAHLPRFLADALAARGAREAADLELPLAGLHPPATLPDIDAAAERIKAALIADEAILVVGDFDADGATATALCVSALRAFGARRVDFLVPNRFEYGYGLTPELVQAALRREPDVILTVDNGTSSIVGVAAAQAAGVDVVVTDHHIAGDELPDACALVNPNLDGVESPSRNLAGVGVAYYVLGAVRAALRAAGHFAERGIPEPKLADWLDLVALGTVADVVPLDRNNRILVHQGLRRMRVGRVRPGIRALAEAARRPLASLSAQDLGFAIAPRLNAAGRLDDMALGIRCLLEQVPAAARRQAGALHELNVERRRIERAMNDQAAALVGDSEVGDDVALCLYRADWHQGVIGNVAGRMRERFHRPVVAFADAGPAAPEELKGSARSIPGLHIRDAIADCAARHPGLVERFGGHAMAAGLGIKRRHLPRFRHALNDVVAGRVKERDLAGIQVTDGTLAAADLALANARLVRDHGPWGKDFEEPTFHGEFDVVARSVVGERHLKLVLKRDDRVVDAIAFNQAPVAGERVRAVYRLGINDFRDIETLQLLIDRIEAC